MWGLEISVDSFIEPGRECVGLEHQAGIPLGLCSGCRV